jgi:hypothetical protein
MISQLYDTTLSVFKGRARETIDHLDGLERYFTGDRDKCEPLPESERASAP